jgi:hypothetical protein
MLLFKTAMTNAESPDPSKEELPLSKAAQFLLEECRMVLPGIQALFGFQLIAVFNPSFSQLLDRDERLLHLIAISLSAVAIALIMTPAAFHRQTAPRDVTEKFIWLASLLLLWSMWPLLAAFCIDFYLIAKIIGEGLFASLLTTAIVGVFVTLWFILPRVGKVRRTMSQTNADGS